MFLEDVAREAREATDRKETMMTAARLFHLTAASLYRASLLGVLLLSPGCPAKLSENYTPKELAKLLAKDGGWRMLVIPDSKFSLGSEVTVKKSDGIRWIGYFKECGVPAAVLEPVVGSSPQMDFSKNIEFSGSAALNLQGVRVGPEFNKVKKVTLHLVDYGADALDLQRLNIWLSDPETKLPEPCDSFLRTSSNYLATQVFRVSKGRYTLYDKDTKKIALSNATIGKYLGEVSAGLTVTSDGSLEFTQPMVIAVRLSSYTNGQMAILGPSADQKTRSSDPLDAVWNDIIERYPGN